MRIAGCVIRERLREGSGLVLYRATRAADHAAVLLKVAARADTQRVAELRHELRLTSRLPRNATLAPLELVEDAGTSVLIIEDPGAVPLPQLSGLHGPLGSGGLELAGFLALARRLCAAVDELHRRGIVHKHLAPYNLFVHPDTGAVRITDFAAAALLTHETVTPVPAHQLGSAALAGAPGGGQIGSVTGSVAGGAAASAGASGGALAYWAPEQTGRMNRGVDARSDLYTLGVVLYELLAGRLPFLQRDPLELVHAHLAQPPPPLGPFGVPPVVAELVARLLAKDPEDRYQSAAGVAADLDRCATILAQTGRLHADFTPGEHDRAATFRLPERLYGREDALAQLTSAFDHAAAGACVLVLISGYSGAGKSALVHEVYPYMAARRGLQVSGKLDQYSGGVPFAALLRTLAGLIDHVLSSSEADMAAWSARITNALGPALPVLVDAIPAARAVVGAQPPPAPAASAADSQNRLESALLRFLGLFARPEQPLVVFLDDLQWADNATLRFVRALGESGGLAHLLLVASYRDHEIGPEHPLTATLPALRRGAAEVHEIVLGPLELGHVARLLGDTLHAPPDAVAELARELFRRTRGNPFFLKEFLRYLYREGLIEFDPGRGGWRWDMRRIDTAGLPDDAVDLVLGELRKLDADTRGILELAACLGTFFTAHTLAVAASMPISQVAQLLWPALERDLVLPLDPSYRLLLDAEAEVPVVRFRFLHDRVRQAAYSLIPGAELGRRRLAMGRRLLAAVEARAMAAALGEPGGAAAGRRADTHPGRLAGQQPHERLDDEMLDAVDHMNAGCALIDDPAERLQLARLDLAAGRRAKGASAYEAAAAYMRAGMSLLGDGEQGWAQDPELAYALAIEQAECAYLCGHLDQADEHLGRLGRRPLSSLQRAQVCNLQMAVLVSRGRAMDALAVGLGALAALGITFPENNQELWAAAARAHAEVQERLAGRALDDLLEAPALNDQDIRAALTILTNMLAPANLNHPALFSLCAAMQANLSLAHGHADESAYGYMVYGMHLATGLGRQEEARAFGRLALALNERRGGIGQVCRLSFVFGSYIHFLEPLREILEHQRRAHDAGMDSGDYIYLSYACSHILMVRLALGEPLDEVAAEADRFLMLMQRTKVASSIAAQTISRRVCDALRGATPALWELSSPGFDEVRFVAELRAAELSFPLSWWSAVNLQLLVLAGEHERAYQAARALGPTPRAGFYFVTDNALYGAVAAACVAATAPAAERPELLSFIEERRARLAEWAERCPANYRHKLLLVEAELARLRGDGDSSGSAELAAASLYDQAIEHAATHGLVSYEAFACERAAELHQAAGRSRTARALARDAMDAYQRWGATAKVQDLAARYAELGRAAVYGMGMTGGRAGTAPASTGDSGSTGRGATTLAAPLPGGDVAGLDLLSVIKASQAFSMEVELERLLAAIMHIVVENAGAERGVLLLEREGELRQVAQEPADPEGSAPIPEALIRYVHRTGEHVVIHDASAEQGRMEPAYVERYRPRSVLCVPIRHQGRPLGVLHLENNLAAGAFTVDRIEVLRLLSAQVGISIKNAVYYQEIIAARDAAQAASLAKSAFLANMSHELRTPLNAIIGYSELLCELAAERNDDELTTDLQSIQKAGKHLLELINNILDFSKIEAQRIEIVVERMALAELVDEAVATVGPAIEQGHNKFDLITDYDLGDIESDVTKIRQILVNVLGNAAKFTTDGRISLEVTRYDVHGADWVRMTVTDTGIGMTGAEMARIFEAFHQADNSASRRYGGTGLGLTITRRLCEMLGGSITVHSELGVGSLFTITLPARLVRENTDVS